VAYRRRGGKNRAHSNRNGSRRWESRGRKDKAGGRKTAIVILGIAAAAAAAAAIAFLLLAGPTAYDGDAWQHAGTEGAIDPPARTSEPPPLPEPAATAEEVAAVEQTGTNLEQSDAGLREFIDSSTHETGSRYQDPPSEEELAEAWMSMLSIINAERGKA